MEVSTEPYMIPISQDHITSKLFQHNLFQDEAKVDPELPMMFVMNFTSSSR